MEFVFHIEEEIASISSKTTNCREELENIQSYLDSLKNVFESIPFDSAPSDWDRVLSGLDTPNIGPAPQTQKLPPFIVEQVCHLKIYVFYTHTSLAI